MSAPLDEPPYSAVDGRVTVYASFAFLKVGQLDAISATFYGDYYLAIYWRDDRLAGLAGMGLPVGLWKPDPERINSASDTTINFDAIPDIWDDESGGTYVTLSTRLSGTLDSFFDLKEFPYDRQSVPIIIESKNYAEDALVWEFEPNVAATPIPPVDGWFFEDVKAVVASHEYPTFEATYSRAIFSINLSRKPTYFVSKYILNVCLIITIALAASFVMEPTDAGRLASSFGAYGAIVSWMFVLVGQVPVLGYNTRLDSFFLVAFITTFVLVLFNGARLVQAQRAAAAKAKAAVEPECKEAAALPAAPPAAPPAVASGWRRRRTVVRLDADPHAALDMVGHVVIAIGFGVGSLAVLFGPM